MINFIKLSSNIINTKYIHKILVTPNKYYIHIINKNINGFAFFGMGSISSENDVITVCQNTDPFDYKIVTDWINYNPNTLYF